MKYRFSDSALKLQGQPMFKVLANVKELEATGQDIVHFEIGDPDFSTPKNIVKAVIESINKGETHYASSLGLVDFHKMIQETTLKTRGFKPDLKQIIVAPGANIIIYYAIACLVNRGDEVILPDPGFPTYYSVINYCGVKPVRVQLKEKNGFRMNPDDVRKKITPKTRLIIINSPHNPTGSVMTPDELMEMAKIAEEHDVYLYSDEIYVRMIYDNSVKFCSPAIRDACKKRTIVANGFSKAFAMTGWRLGVAIAPEDVIDKMGLLLQTTSSCVSPFIQRAGIEAICGDQTEVRHMMKTYEERRNILVKGLNSIKGISCLNPEGAFYVFPNIKKTGLSSEEFAKIMLEKAKVALLPGTNFGKYGEGYIRLCYATSKERIEEGIARIKKTLE